MSQSVHDFVTRTRWEDLSDAARHQAQRCLLDLIGVAAAGTTTDLSRIIRDHAAMQFGGAGSRMLFDGRPVSPAGAALAGGMTIDSVDAHDGHPVTKGHAGCGLLPALVAMVEAEGAAPSGAEFLTTLAVGYEVAIRAGVALHATVSDYHTSGAWVAVGVAAMAARVLGLTGAQAREAMGIAEYHGPRSQMMRTIDYPTMVKDGSGWGAMAGVSAAYLARAGFTGAPALTVEQAGGWDDLGARWMITEQYFKPWPVCRWAQPAVEAALGLQRAHGFTAADVAGLTVRTFHEACRLAAAAPRDTEQAQYSLPFPVAAALVRGTVGPREIGAEGLSDPDILRLAAAVEMVEDDGFNHVFPAERWAAVEVRLADGRVLASPPTTAHGDAGDPMTDDEVDAKFAMLMQAAGGDGAAIRDRVWRLDAAPDARALIDLITAPPTAAAARAAE